MLPALNIIKLLAAMQQKTLLYARADTTFWGGSDVTGDDQSIEKNRLRC